MISSRAATTAVILILSAACSRSPLQREAHYLELGKQQLRKKDYAHASLEFRLAIQMAPEDAEPYFQLGLTQTALGNLPQAVSCFRKALDLNPKRADAQLKLAALLSTASSEPLLEESHRHAAAAAAAVPASAEALDTLALTELRLGKPGDAVPHLVQALRLLPGSLESSALLMRARLAAGDLRGAEQAMDRCYRQAPQSPAVAVVMGRYYLLTKRYSDAEAQFHRAVHLDPNYPGAWMDLGMLLFHSGRQNEAGAAFQQAAALPERTYRPVYALYLLETGQRAAAVAELERLAKADPDDRAARTRLVKMYIITGRDADAGRLLAKALTANPKDADALLQRAELSISARKLQEAENDLHLAMRYRPESAAPHVILAHLRGVQGADLAARQELSQALQLDPGLLAARLELARLLIDSKAFKSALEALEQAPGQQKQELPLIVETNWALMGLGRAQDARRGVTAGLRIAPDSDLLLQDALLKLDSGAYDASLAELSDLLRRNPQNLRALAAVVQLYTSRHQRPLATRAVREHAARHTDSAQVQNFFGELMLADGNAAEARGAFTAALAADTHFRPAQLSLVRLDIAGSNFQAAAKTMNNLLAASPHDPELWLNQGWLKHAQRDDPAAIACFRKVVDADPKNVVALNDLAYLLSNDPGRLDEALQYAQQVKELAPDNHGVDDTIGWIMYRKGMYRAAVQYLEKAAIGDTDSVVQYHLGMAYVKTGDRRGENTLRAALQAAPDLPEARQARELLAQP